MATSLPPDPTDSAVLRRAAEFDPGIAELIAEQSRAPRASRWLLLPLLALLGGATYLLYDTLSSKPASERGRPALKDASSQSGTARARGAPAPPPAPRAGGTEAAGAAPANPPRADPAQAPAARTNENVANARMVSGPGWVDLHALSSALTRYLPDVRRCVGELAGRNISFTLSENGDPKEFLMPGSPVGQKKLRRCVRTRTPSWRLPAPVRGSVTIEVPLKR